MKIQNQGGWTIWSLAFSLFVIGSIAWLGLKTIPLYIDNTTIRNTIKPIAQDRSLSDASYDQIADRIQKGLSINNIRWVKDEDIEFIEEGNGVQVRIDYEKRFKLVSNIDLILTFKNHVMIPGS